MKNFKVKPILFIGCLIALTGLAMASATRIHQTINTQPQQVTSKNGIVTLSGRLVQDKILSGSDGVVSMAISMSADDISKELKKDTAQAKNNVDMVIVLDRSGSMDGQKIDDAKTAIRELLTKLTPSDRFALVIYSDTARCVSSLVNVTAGARNHLFSEITQISAGGGTNLGQGLIMGMNILTSATKNSHAGRLILISDGLANKGITDSYQLGKIASAAVKEEFSVSTAGVGVDFNEELMTAIADHGTGNYYFLENPSAFAKIFNAEFEGSRMAAATAVKVIIRQTDGIRLIEAGGYPITTDKNTAFFFPGDLQAGQTRKLFLNLKIPTDQIRKFNLAQISLQYQYNHTPFQVSLPAPMTLACIKDPAAAMASIDESTWAQKVLKEDFSRLKEAVAGDIRGGRRQEAMKKIDQYYTDQEMINAKVCSESVAENLDKDLNELRQTVDDSFTGEPAAVMQKQKRNAKALQFEGYQDRRKN